MNKENQLSILKSQLKMIQQYPQQVQQALASGTFYAGFGGDLNGIKVPDTFIHGKLPPGVSPQEAYNQVVKFMLDTINEAEKNQNRN